MHQRRNGHTVGIVKVPIAVDGKINDSQKSIGIYILLFTHLLDRLVAKSKADTETSETLKDIVIIPDNAYHAVIRFIHFLILHFYIPYLLCDAK